MDKLYAANPNDIDDLYDALDAENMKFIGNQKDNYLIIG